MALGARSLQVLGLVMRRERSATMLGAGIGVTFAYGLARLLMAINSELGQALVLTQATRCGCWQARPSSSP
jgi:hypothetical protein